MRPFSHGSTSLNSFETKTGYERLFFDLVKYTTQVIGIPGADGAGAAFDH